MRYPHQDDHKAKAHLEWWANPATCLARIPVSVMAAPGRRWDATASPALSHDAREDMRLLIDASPVFTLRFQNGSATEVEVEHTPDSNLLRLSPVLNADPDT
ncbi:hypothetical protein OIE62_22435 [Streptomyces scopuliridis]|uniref:Uncharacterized protein n=1 Tax=Streptomyces scopuliridis TaxID=452529 RepID=A0ACD4ZKI7_9ACTN|nr:hypothetical protein [Streptomyces scopuliridis]WSB34569.1 hypothetical protein OG949_17960 [Streptomyces scopuliridis]WSB98815.1 hypothetical protein OG835_18510 [Streptomyces scopuliridis]WSC07482.1 hypothetical protein OIE62_22435 [Streptomyces scopuliridis]